MQDSAGQRSLPVERCGKRTADYVSETAGLDTRSFITAFTMRMWIALRDDDVRGAIDTLANYREGDSR